MEKLDKLVKSSYTLKEVESRWIQIHKDYDSNFIQEKIAFGELPAFLNLKNCFLFPVEELEKSYNYLELCNDATKDYETYISLALFVKDSQFNLIHNETQYKAMVNPIYWPNKSDIQSSMIHSYELHSSYSKAKYHVINSCDLQSNKFHANKPNNFQGDYPQNYLKRSIIEVTGCGIPVTPFYKDTALNLAIITKSLIPDNLVKLNLSPKRNQLFVNSLNHCCVVKFNELYYYVVNEKEYEFDGTRLNGYSLSNDVAKSFLDGEGVIIKKKDLIEYEKNCFSSQSDILISSNSSTLKIEPHEQTLLLMLEIINDFTNAGCYVKSGSKTQQGLIGDWLETRVPKSTRKDDNGNKGPNRDYIRVLKQLISERYNITTIRSKS